jgi:hypothetical protein
MAPSFMRRRQAVAEAPFAADSREAIKARQLLGQDIRTMKAKTWSAIPCSDADEQRYTNTIQKAASNLFGDNVRISFNDTEPLFVQSGVLRKVKDSYQVHEQTLKDLINEMNSTCKNGSDFQIRELKPALSDGTRASKKYFFVMRGKARDADARTPILQLSEENMVFDRVEAGLDGSIEVVLAEGFENKPIELFPFVSW